VLAPVAPVAMPENTSGIESLGPLEICCQQNQTQRQHPETDDWQKTQNTAEYQQHADTDSQTPIGVTFQLPEFVLEIYLHDLSVNDYNDLCTRYRESRIQQNAWSGQ